MKNSNLSKFKASLEIGKELTRLELKKVDGSMRWACRQSSTNVMENGWPSSGVTDFHLCMAETYHYLSPIY